MCVFCKIIKGEIPCYKIYEDDEVLAFLDVNPTSVGHTLVVCKSHFEHILDCNDETYTHLMLVVKKLSNLIMKKCDAEGLNIITNCKEAAGQTVPHFHVHIIPRYDENDGYNPEFVKKDNIDLLQIQHELKADKL